MSKEIVEILKIRSVSSIVRVLPNDNNVDVLYLGFPTKQIPYSIREEFLQFGHQQWYTPTVVQVPYDEHGYVDIFFVSDGQKFIFNKQQTGRALFAYNLCQRWFNNCVFDNGMLKKLAKHKFDMFIEEEKEMKVQFNNLTSEQQNETRELHTEVLDNLWTNYASQLYTFIMTTDGISKKLETLVDDCVKHSRTMSRIVTTCQCLKESGQTHETQMRAHLCGELRLEHELPLQLCSDVASDHAGMVRIWVCDISREEWVLSEKSKMTNWCSSIPFYQKYIVDSSTLDKFNMTLTSDNIVLMSTKEALTRFDTESQRILSVVLESGL